MENKFCTSTVSYANIDRALQHWLIHQLL